MVRPQNFYIILYFAPISLEVLKNGRYPGRRGTNHATPGGRKETLEEEVLEATVDGEVLKETLCEEVLEETVDGKVLE